MATSLNPLSSTTGASNGSSSASTNNSLTSGVPTESTFLQLLVAQLKYQDPSNPTDSTQFVSQLAQFSQLEQVMGIRSDIESYHADATAAAAATSTTPATGTTQPQS